VVVVVAFAVFLGVLVALEGQVRMRLGRDWRQLDLDAHAPSQRVDRLLPGSLKVVAFGSQGRVGFGPKLERHPLDLDILPRIASCSGNSAR
jgi:hypothetical protein